MERGYVKLWRKLEDSGIIQNPHACQLLIYLLLRATGKKRIQLVSGKPIELNPGDFITGRTRISADLGMSEQSVRTALDILKKTKTITTKSTNKYTIISFVNWEVYQESRSANQPAEHPAQQPASNQEATSNQPASNHKTRKKNEERKNEEKKVAATDVRPDLLEFARKFQTEVKMAHPVKAPNITDSMLVNGAIALERTARIDMLDEEEIKQACLWAVDDAFWGENFLSLAQMRKVGNGGVLKIHSVISAYRKTKAKPIDPRVARGLAIN